MRTEPAAAHENAALAFRQPEKGCLVGDPDMGGGGKFEAAADDCAMQRRQERNWTAFHTVEDRVPEAGVQDTLEGRTLGMFGEVETGAEMVAMAVDDADLRLASGALHRVAEVVDGAVVDRVALGGTIEAEQGDVAFERVGDLGLVRGRRLLCHPGSPSSCLTRAAAGRRVSYMT
jgi:hypothetical protein